ncbi:pituitary tumor-transforming gene 1 protein-interacting protein-like [Polypterus senegalus]|nr:pituitary tumor-transforming gene 1 protein-interacting protein-like [Polypterus senegalus]
MWKQMASKIVFVLIMALVNPGGSDPRASQVELHCSAFNNVSCEECVRNPSCLWCASSLYCIYYPVKTIFLPSSVCKLQDARWGVCWVNFQVLTISFSVLSVMVLLAVIVCCCSYARRQKLRRSRERRGDRERIIQRNERRDNLRMKRHEIRKKHSFFK